MKIIWFLRIFLNFLFSIAFQVFAANCTLKTEKTYLWLWFIMQSNATSTRCFLNRLSDLFGATVAHLCTVTKRMITSYLMLFVHVTWCSTATEFINLVLYVFFCVIMCAYQMTRLALLLHYTSLSQALFSKPLSPIGPTQPSRGNVTRRIARRTFQDGHLVSFIYFSFLLVCSFSYLPMLSNSLLSLSRNNTTAYL